MYFVEFCAPQTDGDTCHVVTGATAILLDSKSAHVQEKAYHAITKGLNNTDFVKQFASTVVRVQFLESLRESLVFSPDQNSTTQPGSATATVAVAAASVSFLVASIFCYGLMRRERRHHSEPNIRHKNRFVRKNESSVVSNPISINARRRFVRLEDFAISPTTYMTTDFSTSAGVSPQDYTPSITWSISDITSDSVSLRSSVSRTTSMLERIEEADEEVDGEYDYDYDNDEEYSCSLHRGVHSSFALSETHFYEESTGHHVSKQVEEFDCVDLEDEPIELQGCRYVEDEDNIIDEIPPDFFEDLVNNRSGPVSREVDDLQVSLDDEEDEDEPIPPILGKIATAVIPQVCTDKDSVSLGEISIMINTDAGSEDTAPLESLDVVPETPAQISAKPEFIEEGVNNTSRTLDKEETKVGLDVVDVDDDHDFETDNNKQTEANSSFDAEYPVDMQQAQTSDRPRTVKDPRNDSEVAEGDRDAQVSGGSTQDSLPLRTVEIEADFECPQTPRENLDHTADTELFWTPAQQTNDIEDDKDSTAVGEFMDIDFHECGSI